MFSKKSSHLIMKVKEQVIRGKTYQAFKPSIDDRYGQDIASHDGLRIPAISVSSVKEILLLTKDTTDVVCIDEIQFYDSKIVETCRQFADNGKIVIVSGLDKDFRDEFFPFKDKRLNMSHLIQAADEITYLQAICNFKTDQDQICGEKAARSQKFVDGEIAPYETETIQIGNDKETEERKTTYASRCRQHFKFYKEKQCFLNN